MWNDQPFDFEAALVDPSRLFAIAQSPTLELAVRRARTIIEQGCAPAQLQIVWATPTPHILPGEGAAPMLPDPAALALLEQGETASLRIDSRWWFVPLNARGELCGWIALELPLCTTEQLNMLRLVASQLGPTIALYEATMSHQEQVRRLQTLTEIGQTLSGVLNLDSLLDSIYEAVRQLMDVSHFYLALYEPARHTFALSYVVCDSQRAERLFRWNADEGLSGEVLRRGTPLFTDDYLSECARLKLRPRQLSDLPIGKAWVGVPLIANDVLIGIMNISSEQAGLRYSQEQVDLLTAIGSQAAVAIANAQLYQQRERQSQQLATLNKIGRTITSSLDPERVPSLIMEQVCLLLDVIEGSLLLVDEDTGDLVFAYTNGPIGSQLLGQRIPRGRGFAGHVVRTGESVIVNNVQGDKRFYDQTDKATGFVTQTMLAVPLCGVAGVQGVIEVMNRRDGAEFTREDQLLLESVADQAVIALENARRFAKIDQALAKRAQELHATNAMLQHNLHSLTALNVLGMALTSSIRDVQDIYTLAAHSLVEAVDAEGAMVLLSEPHAPGAFQVAMQVGSIPAAVPAHKIYQRVLESGVSELLHPTPDATVLIVPLRAPQHSLGVISIFYSAQEPDHSDQETAVLFASQAAAAVANQHLFTEIRSARDELASILASTREGIALIGPDSMLAHANLSLYQLTMLDVSQVQNTSIPAWLNAWAARAAYAGEQWSALRAGLEQVVGGMQRFISGRLDGLNPETPSLEWAVLPVRAGGQALRGGTLLVLRDITAAREAERMRHDLTNMIVHDLRSPLSSVMAAIDMLSKGIAGEMNDSQRSIMNIAYSSAVQMLEMISTLLDISRLEDDRLPLSLDYVPIEMVMGRASKMLASLAQDRNIAIRVDMPAQPPIALIDGDLITRVIQNLLGNAIKFSNRGDDVVIRVSYRDGQQPMLVFAVVDSGIGIAQTDQSRVFTKFGQVGESRGGSGLGLTFCKLVVEAHGGQIWLESEVGRGSTFFFSVPFTQEPLELE